VREGGVTTRVRSFAIFYLEVPNMCDSRDAVELSDGAYATMTGTCHFAMNDFRSWPDARALGSV
jgi:hypothetical protein